MSQDGYEPDELEAALIEGASFLQSSISATVPLRDYAASVEIVAEALGLSLPEALAPFSDGIPG